MILNSEIDATTVAGHLGVEEARTHFPAIEMAGLSDGNSNLLGCDWPSEKEKTLLLGTGNVRLLNELQSHCIMECSVMGMGTH